MRARSLGSPPGEVSRRGTTTRNCRIQCGNSQRPNDAASSAAHSVSRFPSPTSPCECGEGSGVGVLSFNTLGLSLLNHPPPRLAQGHSPTLPTARKGAPKSDLSDFGNIQVAQL